MAVNVPEAQINWPRTEWNLKNGAREALAEGLSLAESGSLTAAFHQAFGRHVLPDTEFKQQSEMYDTTAKAGRDPSTLGIAYHPQVSMPESVIWAALDNPDKRAVVLVDLGDVPPAQHFNELWQLNESFSAKADQPGFAASHSEPLTLTREALFALELLRETRQELAQQRQADADTLRFVAELSTLRGPESVQAGLDILQGMPRFRRAGIATPSNDIQAQIDAEARAEARVAKRVELGVLSREQLHAIVAAGTIMAATSVGLAKNEFTSIANELDPAPVVALNLSDPVVVRAAAARQGPNAVHDFLAQIEAAFAPHTPNPVHALTQRLEAAFAPHKLPTFDHALATINKVNFNALSAPNDKAGTFQSIFMAVDVLRDRNLINDGWQSRTDEERVHTLVTRAKLETGFDPRLAAAMGHTPDRAAGLLQIEGPEFAVKMMQFRPQIADLVGKEGNEAIDGMFDSYARMQQKKLDRAQHIVSHHHGYAPSVVMKSRRDVGDVTSCLKHLEHIREHGVTRPTEDTGLLRSVYATAPEILKAEIRKLRTSLEPVTFAGYEAPRGGALTAIVAGLMADETHINPQAVKAYGYDALDYLVHQNGATTYRKIEPLLLDHDRLQGVPNAEKAEAALLLGWQHLAITHHAAQNPGIWITAEARAEHKHKNIAYRAGHVEGPDGVIDNVNRLTGHGAYGAAGVTLYRQYRAGGQVMEADAKGQLVFRMIAPTQAHRYATNAVPALRPIG